jgi:glycosyltransferase involved in cell wall biosynthesis
MSSISLHFDNIIYKLQKTGGISRYWREITARINKDNQFTTKFTDGSKIQRFLPILSNAEIFHSSHFRTTFDRQAKVVSTIHDMTYERSLADSSASVLGLKLNIWQRKRAIEKADAIICVSESTKQEMLDIYPRVASKRIEVIHHGCSFDRSIIIPSTATKRLNYLTQTEQRFALYVGDRSSYKNFNSALLGFAESELAKNNFLLVCTGSKFTDLEQSLVRQLNLHNSILMIDCATEIEMHYLYQNAFALLYTSSYEGFGLPPLEAMNCGTPVIAANQSSMPEIIGDAGILLTDIKDSSLISHALNRLLDADTRNMYIQMGRECAQHFTWERSANQHMKLYQSMLG